MLGSHCVRHFSRTQATVALSSAEAELAACVKASADSIGMQQAALDLGMDLKITIRSDASAALGAIARRGSGRMKHVNTQWLWVQEASRKGVIRYEKVCTTVNLADLLTKAVSSFVLRRLLNLQGCLLLGDSD